MRASSKPASSARAAPGSLAAARDGQHDDVECLAEVRARRLGHERLDDQQRDRGAAARRTAPENARRVGVVPVVQQIHQQVEVGRRQRVDEEVCRRRASSRAPARVSAITWGLEQNAARLRRALEDQLQEMAAAAADVGDRGERAEVVRRRDGGSTAATC